jgi:RNase P/RNase MRP subunit POP5
MLLMKPQLPSAGCVLRLQTGLIACAHKTTELVIQSLVLMEMRLEVMRVCLLSATAAAITARWRRQPRIDPPIVL